jgi:hypothetical protein
MQNYGKSDIIEMLIAWLTILQANNKVDFWVSEQVYGLHETKLHG